MHEATLPDLAFNGGSCRSQSEVGLMSGSGIDINSVSFRAGGHQQTRRTSLHI